MVSCRQEAGSVVPNTNLELQQTADHPCWGRHHGQGVVRQADEPRARLLSKEIAISNHSDPLSPSA